MTCGRGGVPDLPAPGGDAGLEELSSALMSFDLYCLGPVVGCIRFSSSWDAGAWWGDRKT